jgi:hypothetical protein
VTSTGAPRRRSGLRKIGVEHPRTPSLCGLRPTRSFYANICALSLRNPRYERFAYELAEGKPAYQAYIDAGFAKEREQIDAEGTKLAIARTAIDKEWVIERLRENVERAMQARPVLDRAGNPTVRGLQTAVASSALPRTR